VQRGRWLLRKMAKSEGWQLGLWALEPAHAARPPGASSQARRRVFTYRGVHWFAPSSRISMRTMQLEHLEDLVVFVFCNHITNRRQKTRSKKLDLWKVFSTQKQFQKSTTPNYGSFYPYYEKQYRQEQ
jgi:hypothetical protein